MSRKFITKRKFLNDLPFLIVIFLLVGIIYYYQYFYKPKNSLELYQELAFAEDFEDVQKLILDGYELNFSEEHFNDINKRNSSARAIMQFTLFEYGTETFVIMTSPGTHKLNILAVDRLPEHIREYFIELSKEP